MPGERDPEDERGGEDDGQDEHGDSAVTHRFTKAHVGLGPRVTTASAESTAGSMVSTGKRKGWTPRIRLCPRG